MPREKQDAVVVGAGPNGLAAAITRARWRSDAHAAVLGQSSQEGDFLMIEIAMRWGGLSLIVGAILLGVATVLISLNPVVNQPLSPRNSLLLLLASIFLLLSLPVMYAKQIETAGWLGLAGFVLLQTGILLLVVMSSTPLLYPSLEIASGENIVVFLLGIALTLGLLLTGIATIQAGVHPQWAGIALLAATAGFFFVFLIAEFLPRQSGQIGSALFGIVLTLAFVGIGFSMWAS